MYNTIGKAMAGHAARGGDKNNPALAEKASKYTNELTQLVDIVIAEEKLRIDRERQRRNGETRHETQD